MQKVLISRELLPFVMQGESLFKRADIKIYTAATTDEILKIHIEEIVNLILLQHNLPGTSSEDIFSIIRQSHHLRDVLIIMSCDNNTTHQDRCRHCGAHAILPTPIDPALLHQHVQQFLNIARRQSYRVTLNVSVDSKVKSRHFLCRTENISATGALISSEQELSPGDIISCSFFLPDMTKISVKGEVMRVLKQEGSGATHYGIKYIKIPADCKARIETFIKNNRG